MPDTMVVRRTFLGRLAAAAAALAGTAAPSPAGAQAPPGGRGLNVKSFGARGDNTADDTGAIRQAISAAATSGQGVIHFPPGNYRVTGPLTLTDAITFVGDGVDVSTIRHHGVGNAIAMPGTATAQIVKTSIRDMSILGDGVSSDVGLLLTYASYGFYQNVRVAGFRTGISVRDSWCLSFEQVTAESCRQDGWQFGRDANNVGMKNCVALKNARAGYSLAGPRGLVLFDCDAEENGTGVVIAAAPGLGTEKISILGGYYEGNITDEISIRSDGGGVRPKAITIRDAYFVHTSKTATSGGTAVRVRDVITLGVEGCHFSARGDGYKYSLYLQDSGAVAGVIWGSGNLDESSAGRYKGSGTSLSVLNEMRV
jgi:hypothetical protein